MLSNIYLHEVLDKWYFEQVQLRLRERAYLVRFADDAVMIFSDERDPLRVMEVLPKRFGKYGLKVHPEKTRMIRFNRPRNLKANWRSGGQRETFDFLGFTHYWGFSRKGNWIVKRKTEKSRFGRALRAVSRWCKWNRHMSIREQHKALQLKLRGHYNYYGITGNLYALRSFWYEVHKVWRKWLNRRTRGNAMLWEKFNLLLLRYPLPAPRVVHSIYVAKL